MLSSPRIARLAWIVYWIALFVLTHIPVPPRIPGIRHGDKLLHLVAYFVLTFLGGWARRHPAGPNAHFLWAGIFAAYAVLDEYLQQFTGRTMSWADLIADWLGIGMATAILLVTPAPESVENAEDCKDAAHSGRSM